MHETIWSFVTERFRVACEITYLHCHQYDGDDESGETQRDLDCGNLTAFDTRVSVWLDGLLIGADYLGASIYEGGKVGEFVTAHRDPDHMNRNCSLMRATHPAGPNVSICHYFPDMVREAIKAARQHLANTPRLRSNAA